MAKRLGEMGINTVQQMFDAKIVGFGAGGGEGTGAGRRVLPCVGGAER